MSKRQGLRVRSRITFALYDELRGKKITKLPFYVDCLKHRYCEQIMGKDTLRIYIILDSKLSTSQKIVQSAHAFHTMLMADKDTYLHNYKVGENLPDKRLLNFWHKYSPNLVLLEDPNGYNYKYPLALYRFFDNDLYTKTLITEPVLKSLNYFSDLKLI